MPVVPKTTTLERESQVRILPLPPKGYVAESGLRHYPGKVVDVKASRRFKSFRIRHCYELSPIRTLTHSTLNTIMNRLYPLMLGMFLCSGCAHPLTNPLNISKALTNVYSDLKDTGAVSMTSIDAWTIETNGTFEKEVRAAQCMNDMADPLVAVIPREVIMGIRQAFQTNGQLSGGGYVWPIPEIAIIGQSGLSSTQTLSVPVRFTFVSNIPNLRHMVDEEKIASERDRLLELQTKISHLIADFSPDSCRE